MALSDIDRGLLERCIARKPKAWEEFVDRFMGLVVHVVNHTLRVRSLHLSAEDREDLCAAVFLEIVKDDFAVLRHFRRQSSLATYLTVVARRVVVHELMRHKSLMQLGEPAAVAAASGSSPGAANASGAAGSEVENRIADREEVERLLEELEGHEADVVRLYHLEGMNYHEIGAAVGISPNSVGPLLSRARGKMRRASAQQS